MREKMVVAEERQLELEAEVRSLKAAVVDAQTNAEQLEEMGRCVESEGLFGYVLYWCYSVVNFVELLPLL